MRACCPNGHSLTWLTATLAVCDGCQAAAWRAVNGMLVGDYAQTTRELVTALRRARTEECVIVFNADGTAVGLYSDAVPWDALGTIIDMPRASRVEFDVPGQRWVARDAGTDAIIAEGASREAVLEEERRHYLNRLRAGQIPVPGPCAR